MFGLLKNSQDKEKTQQGVRRSRETWFGRITNLLHSSGLSDDVWEELEEILISADVGVDTSFELIQKLRARSQEGRFNDPDQIFASLKGELVSRLDGDSYQDVWEDSTSSSLPYVILVVGVNGVGKTTSIAKIAYHFKNAGKKVILGAGDTFRAAATQQLQVLGQRAGVDVVAHKEGADPGAVVYDAFQAAKARGADVLIVDTAGRLHTKTNLMEELKKIKRVLSRLDPAAPHQVLLILDATTGYNGLSQAKYFTEAVDCTGIFLAKLDGTAKGGIVLAINHELHLPILFIGTGEGLEDMAQFEAKVFVDALLEPVNTSGPE